LNIQLRNARFDDIPEMMRLERQSPMLAHWTEQQYREIFEESGQSSRLVLLAEGTGGTVIGFLVARHLTPEWELENIVVASQAQRSGVGTRLLAELLVRAQQSNSSAVFLEVRESNTAARKLYEAFGFSTTGRRKSYYLNPLEDAILYAKKVGCD